MKQIFIRLLFGAIVLGANILIISPQVLLLSKYTIDLSVLIPFLALLFLEPFVFLFNPWFCSIKHLNKIVNDDGSADINHKIEYAGNSSIKVRIKSVLSTNYNISCQIEERAQTPEQVEAILSKEKQDLLIRFHLVPTSAMTESQNKVMVIYKIGCLTKKIKLK
jgi:hypothetical protein